MKYQDVDKPMNHAWTRVFPAMLIAGVMLLLSISSTTPRSQAAPNAAALVRTAPVVVTTTTNAISVPVDIMIEDVNGLYGADVRLSFNPALLAVQDANPGQAGIQIGLGPLLTSNGYYVVFNTADNVSGTIQLVITQLNPAEPITGSGVLANITFRPVGPTGVSALHFTQVKLASRTGISIPATTQDGTLAIQLLAADDVYITNEDAVLTVSAPGVLANDGNALTATLASAPSHGALTLNPNGSFIYTPTAAFNGVDSFTYRANDGTVDSNVATVSITVNAINGAPVAVNDSYTTDEDVMLSIPIVTGVLANDTDADGNSLTAIKVSNPAHGALTLNSNGSFTYVPVANFNGVDSFTYRANDGSVNSNVATVSITVNAINDAPVAVNDTYTTGENVALTIAAPGVVGNDSDIDGDTLTASRVSDPVHGTLILNSNGSFTYTPAANYHDADSFTYRAHDGTSDGNVATVAITVNAINDVPVAANDAYTINENTALTLAAPGVLGNDSDIDGDTLTAVKVSDPSHGVLTLISNGSFTYTPTANFSGVDSFTYRANDGVVNSNIATVAITIALNNPVPMITSLNPVTVTAGSPPFSLTVTGANFVGGSTIHWDGAALATTVVSSTQLQATIDTDSILITGTISVTVANPTPGGGLSNVLTLTVEGPSPAPQDRLIYLPLIVRGSPPVAAPPVDHLIHSS